MGEGYLDQVERLARRYNANGVDRIYNLIMHINNEQGENQKTAAELLELFQLYAECFGKNDHSSQMLFSQLDLNNSSHDDDLVGMYNLKPGSWTSMVLDKHGTITYIGPIQKKPRNDNFDSIASK